MRNLFCRVKWDKKYLIAFIIVFLCSVISGIVLCIATNTSNYLYEFACDYVYYVFNFKSGTLFFSRFLSSVFYFYIFYLFGRFSNLKYAALALVFIKGVFLAMYIGIIISMNIVGGGVVIIFVFLPSSLVSLVFCYIISETRDCFGRYSTAAPAVFALSDAVLLLIFVNVIFRAIIAIV